MKALKNIWERVCGKGTLDDDPKTELTLIPGDSQIIMKLNYRPSEPVVAAMQSLFDKGIEDFVLFGGAIRDDILGTKINDYDVMCQWHELLSPRQRKKLSKDVNGIDELKAQDEKIHGLMTSSLEEKGFQNVTLTERDRSFFKYSMQDEGGADFDLLVHHKKYSPVLRILVADDTISSAIYTSGGECFADRRILNHLTNKQLVHTSDIWDGRIEKLQRKIEGLTLVDESDCSKEENTAIILTDNPRMPHAMPF